MASSRPPANPVDLEVTIVSAKHLKNVNWRHGELKPYAVVYLDPDRRFATKPDDSGSVKPVWNERITVPFPFPQPGDPPLILTVDVFHSKPSETPKPLVGSARSPLRELLGSDDLLAVESGSGSVPVSKTLDLRRPSGRPQGKIRIKISLRDHPFPPESDYPAPGPAPAPAPPTGYLYSPVRDLVRDYRAFSAPPPPVSLYGGPVPPPNYPYASYPDPYYSSAPGYYSSGGAGYYSAPAPAPAPARPYYDRVSGYGGGPSAPVDYSSGPAYEQKARGGRAGVGAGLAVGAVTGALGAMTLDENLERWDGKVSKRAETDLAARDDYSDYRADH